GLTGGRGGLEERLGQRGADRGPVREGVLDVGAVAALLVDQNDRERDQHREDDSGRDSHTDTGTPPGRPPTQSSCHPFSPESPLEAGRVSGEHGSENGGNE